jgi:tight adherence protein B
MIALIVLVTAAAAVALTGTVGVLVGRREAALERRLAGYERAPEVVANDDGKAITPGVQQAVDLTSRLAERTGILTKVERALERGDVPIRAGELIFYGTAVVVMVFLGVSLLAGPLYGVIVAGLVAMLPVVYVSRQQRTRQQAFERQLPDTLTLLSSSLRAGFSFMQGLEAVAQEIGAPMRRELQRVFTEVRLGRAPEDALGEAAERMGSNDLAWTVMAIRIQREVGGNLATLLDTVADTMQKRDRIRREIRALTAEGRLSAIILGLLPPVAGIGLFFVAPDYMKTLFDHGIGIAAVIASVVLAIVGWFWLRRIVDIEV